MQVEFIFRNYHEGVEVFKKNVTKSEWDRLLMVVDGEISILPHAKSKPIVLRKNEIAFIPSDVEFEQKVLSPVTYYSLFFHAQKDHPFYLAASLGKMQLPPKQAEAIIGSVKRANILPYDREPTTSIIVHTFCENYLFGKKDNDRPYTLSEKVEEAIQYMRNNLDKRIDMEALAAHVCLSHSGLIWKFRQELNTTPSQYLILLRLRHAKQLLLNYSYNITEIAEMCGYQNPYYFTNAFRKYSGRSPTEFRKYHMTYRK